MSDSNTSSITDSTSERDTEVSRCVIVSVEKTSSPDGTAGGDWYRYVIDSPGSPITGYRHGKKKEVLEYLKECTGQLDERRNPRKGSRAKGRKAKRA